MNKKPFAKGSHISLFNLRDICNTSGMNIKKFKDYQFLSRTIQIQILKTERE